MQTGFQAMGIGDALGPAAPTAWQVGNLLRSPLDDLYKQTRLAGLDGSSLGMIGRLWRDDAARRAAFPDVGSIAAFSDLTGHERWRDIMAPSPFAQAAQRAAELTQSFSLPDVLIAHRSSFEEMTLKLMRSPETGVWGNPAYLTVLNEASALGDLYAGSTRVTRAVADANRVTMLSPAAIGSVREYQFLLDVAGLTLPRWPRVRLLDRAEKRRRFKARLNGNIEPPHVRKAKSLVHRYELTLRGILDAPIIAVHGGLTAYPEADARCRPSYYGLKQRCAATVAHSSRVARSSWKVSVCVGLDGRAERPSATVVRSAA